MLISFIRPKSIYGRSFYNLLIGYLVIGLIGCSTPPRVEKPATSVARAMETRSFSGKAKPSSKPHKQKPDKSLLDKKKLKKNQ